MKKVIKVTTVSLGKLDLAKIIAENAALFETGYVLLNAKKSEVLVKDKSAADIRFRKADAGDIVPIGSITVKEVIYHRFRVNPKLLS